LSRRRLLFPGNADFARSASLTGKNVSIILRTTSRKESAC
jgi:hypothetical protein